MWLFLNDAFLSVVQDRNDPNRLLVRSRDEQGLRRVLPNAEVFEDAEADYRWRTFVTRSEWAEALARETDRIQYDNFKASVTDSKRHDAYLRVWRAMAEAFGAYGRSGKP